MALNYGVVKCKLASAPRLKPSRRRHEIQYHLHVSLSVPTDNGGLETWDTAINVGTNDSDDLLRYRLVFDFHHNVSASLAELPAKFHDLTGTSKLPALDFLRSDVLAETGRWRDSDVLDGSMHPEPVASLNRLLLRAKENNADIYVFGRTYTDGSPGIHDVHMNQGSTSEAFMNNGEDDHNDHNDIWQDGAVLVDLGDDGWAGYFTAFTQQLVPTNDLGNPKDNAHEINDTDPGSLTPR